MNLSYTENAQRALDYAQEISRKLKHFYVGSEHILIGLLAEGEGVAYSVLKSSDLEKDDVINLIKDITAKSQKTLLKERHGVTPRTQRILDKAEEFAIRYHQDKIGTEHILLAIIKEDSCTAYQILLTLHKTPVKIFTQCLLAMGMSEGAIKEELKELRKSDAEGNKGFLEQYSKNMTKMAAEGRLDPVIGREDEINRVVQILSRRTKNNPCLVGEPGVGKTAIVEGLATRIANGDVPKTVQGKTVLSLDLAGMVAGTKYRGEFEERMKKLIKEVSNAGDVILFLDEIHTLIGAGGSEGAIDASSMLKPALARGEIQLIGATTLAEYRKYIEKDAALERRFQPIDVSEPSQEEAMRILKGVSGNYEKHHHVRYTEEALTTCVSLSARYINDRFLPDKAIDIMDEAGALVKLRKTDKPDKTVELKEEISKLDDQIGRSLKIEAFTQAVELRRKQEALIKKLERLNNKKLASEENDYVTVTEDDIAAVVAVWTKVPVKKLAQKESERLLKLEDTLHKRVIGQTEAVSAISRAMRRQRVGLQDPNRPLGSFLFLGPTGVGKTELSKALAEAMFGSEEAIIRVDMSEYMEGHSVSKLIGSPPGYVGFEDGGQLSDKVRRNPYSVILFDEVEKAHPDVFNVLLQVLDDGHITDSKGRKVNFKNTIIIMTSNAGAQRIVDPKNLGFSTGNDEKKNHENMKGQVMEEVKRMFKPEFINRIDEIIVFHSLNKENMMEICTLLSASLVKRCKEQMDIKLTISKELKEFIVNEYADKKMGARPIKRAIMTVIEDPLSESILRKDICPGDKVVAKVKDKKAVFVKSSK
ncbi:MAG: ATP-dependent Clp protease ATP-binding subunit [Lachnospiraceae bacterium]|nr:ATP-dependent Clp protease ATP-binding subunit [Lachnospiraceae bacterium]